MSHFDDETRVSPLEALPDGAGTTARFVGHVHPAWNIGANPNGGYLLALAARAMQQRTPMQSDPLSISVHYLRPGLSGMPCHIDTHCCAAGARSARSGRRWSRTAAPGWSCWRRWVIWVNPVPRGRPC